MRCIVNMENGKELPRSFRTCRLEGSLSVTEQGLAELALSGSGQFSQLGLEALLERLEAERQGKPLLIVDLREESHGFVDGTAVSWYQGEKNWGNRGKKREQIEEEQAEFLDHSLLAGGLSIYPDKESQEAIDWKVESVSDEAELLASYGLAYRRLYVTDHRRPDDRAVDEFLALFRLLGKDHWLHFHCGAGKGRTTTFMVMCDILVNGSKVSFEDILTRQWLIGGKQLNDSSSAPQWKLEAIEERLAFLHRFYDYVVSQPRLELSWSNWLSLNQPCSTGD